MNNVFQCNASKYYDTDPIAKVSTHVLQVPVV